MLLSQKERIARMPYQDSGSSSRDNVLKSSQQQDKANAEFDKFVITEVNKIYKKGSSIANETIEGLIRQFRSKSTEQSRNAFFDDVRHVLKARDRILWQYSNVLRKKKEVFESQANPGHLDVYSLVPEMEDRMGFKPFTGRWDVDVDKYGPKYSDLQSQQEIIDSIINDGNDVLHTRPLERTGSLVAPGYNRYLHLAAMQTNKALKENTQQIQSLVSTGNFPTKSQQNIATNSTNSTNKAKKLASDSVYWGARNSFEAFRNLSKLAGRGIWSKSDPKYNSSLQRYYDNRDRVLSDLLWNVNPKKNKNSELLKRLQDILKKSRASVAELEEHDGPFDPRAHGLIDEGTFRELSDLVTAEISKQDGEHAKQMEDFNRRMNEINAKALDSAKDKTNDEDEMWKWRVLQLALIVTPFAGLSIMGPITNVFSGVFMNAGGLGHGIASLASSDGIPGLGHLCELLHIDEAIEWLLTETPVVGDAVGLVDSVIASNIVQGTLGGIILPLAASPLTPIAIAGVYSLFRLNSEIEHYKKYSDAFKSHEENFKSEIEKISQEAHDAPEKWNPVEFVKKKSAALFEFNQKSELVDYLGDKTRSNPNILKEIMGDDFANRLAQYQRVKGDGTIAKAIDANGKVVESELMNFIDESLDNKVCYDKILLYAAMERIAKQKAEAASGGVSSAIDEAALMKSYKTTLDNSKERSELIESEKKLRKEDYILQIAKDNGIDCRDIPDRKDPHDSMERAKKIATLEGKILESEVAFLKSEAHYSNNSDLRKYVAPLPGATSPSGYSPFALQQNNLPRSINV